MDTTVAGAVSERRLRASGCRPGVSGATKPRRIFRKSDVHPWSQVGYSATERKVSRSRYYAIKVPQRLNADEDMAGRGVEGLRSSFSGGATEVNGRKRVAEYTALVGSLWVVGSP
jgi:hypothetical protein